MPNRFRVVVTDFLTDDLRPELEVLGDLADVVAEALEQALPPSLWHRR